jgi:hypothetical protein
VDIDEFWTAIGSDAEDEELGSSAASERSQRGGEHRHPDAYTEYDGDLNDLVVANAKVTEFLQPLTDAAVVKEIVEESKDIASGLEVAEEIQMIRQLFSVKGSFERNETSKVRKSRRNHGRRSRRRSRKQML